MREPSTEHDATHDPEHEIDAPPPLLGSWRNLYIAVIVTLIAAIVTLRILSEIYA